MRLVCPNCDAEYEVDAAAIPDGGRDVQCSNCGHAWFQLSPEVEAELAAEEALFDAPPRADIQPAAVAADLPVSDTDKTDPVNPEPEGPDPAPLEPAPPAPEPISPAPAPRSIDESVLAVLREEAEREVEARKVEAPVVETQTELGLEAPAAGGMGAVARRLARMKGEPEVVVKPQTRREMLPEIEEINSTLRASSEKRSGQAAAISETMDDDDTKKSGFRSGFVLMLVLAVALLLVYVMAPKLEQQFPAAAGALQAFVSTMDVGRLWVDSMLKSAIGFLHGLAGGQY
ncbi:MAG: zinc-ribbon domain-containing protein [Cypionkella sp.]|uniref:zinc-ribbon domain-containing protein n=1 Tax=Cypionkella sp. TaxID=2811411 RepID=UPI002AB9313C|nr:zinc-ribbon domain-containing protein [Cypionkella sp.]MDZ4312740.1 zinc-ribbon domain-containing protein [Cypionkella sp.]MDZ4395065.1 zinc-ribbon domain-containing protein [Cypionkella sp.]